MKVSYVESLASYGGGCQAGVSTAVRDALTDMLREGARELLAQAVEAEVAEFLGQYRSEQDKTGDLAWGLLGRSCKVQRVIAPPP